MQILQLYLHIDTELFIQRAERLVEQQYCRLRDNSPRQRDALALSARKLVYAAIGETRETHQIKCLLGILAPTAFALAAQAQAVFDILADTHMGKQRIMLEYGCAIALVGARMSDVLAVD